MKLLSNNIFDCTNNKEKKIFDKNINNEPYIIKGFSKNWKAQKKWDFKYIGNLDSKAKVNVVVGDVITDNKDFTPMSLKEYMSKITNKNFNKYLTTYHLFYKYPFLKKDINIDKIKKISIVRHFLAWIGPKGSRTGLHMDWGENVNYQIRGTKIFYLISPEYDKFMYISNKFERISRTSNVDLGNFNIKKFPLFKNVKILKFRLKPTDAIYISEGWWYYVESLSPSINVSIHFFRLRDLFKKLPFELFKIYLHDWGLYKKTHCACHRIKNGKFIRRG